MLLPMDEPHLHTKLPMQMFGYMLCTVNRTMLSARASERNGKAGKPTLHITLDRSIDQGIHMLQKDRNFSVIFQETDHRFVQSGQRFIAFVLSGIVDGPAIEHKTAPIAGRIFRYTFFIRETGHCNNKRRFFLRILVQFGQPAQHLTQIRIFRIRLAKPPIPAKGETIQNAASDAENPAR